MRDRMRGPSIAVTTSRAGVHMAINAGIHIHNTAPAAMRQTPQAAHVDWNALTIPTVLSGAPPRKSIAITSSSMASVSLATNAGCHITTQVMSSQWIANITPLKDSVQWDAGQGKFIAISTREMARALTATNDVGRIHHYND